LGGCAPSYWVRPEEWSQVSRRETIEAENDAGEKVRLKAEKLDDATTETQGNRVRVHPYNRRYKAAIGLLTVGQILMLASTVAFTSTLAPCTGDEACWLPQLVAGATFASVGFVSIGIGSALLPSALNDTLATSR
jgi:hypothetical protein